MASCNLSRVELRYPGSSDWQRLQLLCRQHGLRLATCVPPQRIEKCLAIWTIAYLLWRGGVQMRLAGRSGLGRLSFRCRVLRLVNCCITGPISPTNVFVNRRSVDSSPFPGAPSRPSPAVSPKSCLPSQTEQSQSQSTMTGS